MSDRTSQSPSTAPSQATDSTWIPTIRPQTQKPRFSRPESSALDLQQRLKTFLPQMAAANAELEKLEQDGALEGKRLEDVGDGEEYVEMDLGLGVLEDKHRDEGSSSEEDSSDEESSEDGTSSEEGSDEGSNKDQNSGQRDGLKKTKQKEKETDIMGKLMGHKTGHDTAAGIEEVE